MIDALRQMPPSMTSLFCDYCDLDDSAAAVLFGALEVRSA
jgi:hypothetical protein